MTRKSFERGLLAPTRDMKIGVPSAVIGLFPVVVPLFAVSTISISESFHLPPLGSGGDRVLMDTHDDTISISAVLPGTERFVWKSALELLAQVTLGVNPWQSLSGGLTGGMQLWTSMTLRSDIYIKNLSFSATAQKRDAIDVTLTLAHLPRNQLLTLGLEAVGVGAAIAIDMT